MSEIDTEIRHVTKAGTNLFSELGFAPEEAAAYLVESEKCIQEQRHSEVGTMNPPTKTKALVTTAVDASANILSRSAGRIAVAVRDAIPKDARLVGVSNWVVALFIKALRNCSVEQDRMDAVAWLATARETVSDASLNTADKAKRIYALTDSKRLAKGIFQGVNEAYKNYKNSDIPLAVKVAIPITLSAGAIIGGPSVGIAGFGSAIGVPVLLVLFLGAAGITSVLEAVLSNSEAKDYVSVVAAMIARDEILRRSNQAMRQAMAEEIVPPSRKECRKEHEEIREMLFRMNPYDFEKHVMSFFQEAGLLAWATKKSNDAGVDGFARHPNGLIVVQCKHYAEDNGIGRPTVQQFKGVVEENAAWRGYIVTTSYFTKEAIDSAGKNSSLILVDIRELIEWHFGGVNLPQPT